MYHLPDERELVFAECKRIAKEGAIIAFAYISQTGCFFYVMPENMSKTPKLMA